MIEATCGKCSATMQFDDDDVPPSGKIVACKSCSSPVTVMPAAEPVTSGIVNPLDLGALAAGKKKRSVLDGAEPDAAQSKPSKANPLAGADMSAAPGPKPAGPLAGALSGSKKPPPVPKHSPLAGADIAASPKQTTVGLGDALDLPPSPGSSGLGDLPAPASPRPKQTVAGLGDLPAPKAPGVPDLPAPKVPGMPDLPAPKAPGGLGDLPAPRTEGKSRASTVAGIGDLPAPRAPGSPLSPPKQTVAGIGDLPAPKTSGGLGDLPAPKASAGFGDLPAPKPAVGLGDLPAPASKSIGDLPAPKALGGLSDLPAPKAAAELPDLLAPANPVSGNTPALDLPAPTAPKLSGLDLPEPKPPTTGGALDLDDLGLGGAPPPKGNDSSALSLDDLELGSSPPAAPSSASAATELSLDDAFGAPPSPGKSKDDDPFALPELELPQVSSGAGKKPEAFDLGDAFAPIDSPTTGGDGGEALSLDGLALETPSTKPASDSFDGLELPSPGGAPSPGPASGRSDDGVISFGKPSAAAKSRVAKAREKAKAKAKAAGPLELDVADDLVAAEPAARSALAKAAEADIAAARAAEAEASKPKKKKLTKKSKLIIAATVLGLMVLGGGGFGFMKWQAATELRATVEKSLTAAATALVKGEWNKAVTHAKEALKSEKTNIVAMAFALQARYAEVIDSGTELGKNAKETNDWSSKLQTSTAQSPEIEKAEGLRLLVEGGAAAAVKRLKVAATQQPTDGNAFLFLGWAHQANFAYADAEAAFGKALKRTPKRIPALYGLARAQMAQSKTKEADATLTALIELDKNHLGALLSKAELAEVNRFGERERRYLEILARKDLAESDKRELSRGWALAGSEAIIAGRLGEAQDRFVKALDLKPDNLDAVVGSARVDLAEKRAENALSKVTKVLGLQGNHLDAQLTLAEVRLAMKQYDEALAAVGKILDRDPPVQSPVLLTRAHMVRGKIFAAHEETLAEAEADFKAAKETTFTGDIAPTVALSELYNRTGRGSEAVDLLKPIEEAAKDDPALAVTLGVAYLGAKDADSATNWFRTALELRPDDVEAKYQLGIAMLADQKYDEATLALEDAYHSANGREDIGIRLALLYDSLGNTEAAYQQYETLLGGDSPSINLRSQAGRFFAKVGDTDRAAGLGDSILAEQPKNPAGLYLKGEALMAEEKLRDAREFFEGATQNDPQPQFFEGLGRASEKLGDFNPALIAYGKAIEGDPKFMIPRLSRARIFVAQRRYGKALEELDSAAKVDPENADVYFYRGKTLTLIKKYDDAIEALSKSIRLDARRAEAHYHLGIAYYNSDKARQAASALATATRQSRGDEKWLLEAYRVLGYSSRSAGNKAAAVAAFRNYLDRAPQGTREVDEVKRLFMRLQAP